VIGRRRRAGLAGALATLGLVACNGEGDTGDRVEPMVAVVDSDGHTLVPDGPLPAGLVPRIAQPSTPAFAAGWLALYGDPADPLGGDVVLAAYEPGSESGGMTPGAAASGFTWVSRTTEDDDQETDRILLGARGARVDELDDMLARAELLPPVEHESEVRPVHLARDDVEDDLVLLAEGPVDLREAWWSGGKLVRGGPVIEWLGPRGESSLRITAVEADAALELLMRSVIDDQDGTQLRGSSGALGQPITPGPGGQAKALLAAWEEGGLLVIVETTGLDADDVRRAIEELRPSRAGDWAAIDDEIELAPPPARSDEFVNGHFAGGRWWIERIDLGGQDEYEIWIEATDGTWASGGGGGCPIEAGAVGHELGSLLTGLAPAATSGLELVLADGEVVTPAIHHLGDMVLWTAWVPTPVVVQSVTIHGPEGVVLGEFADADGRLVEATPSSSSATCLQR
jgi:hypothetical protein